MSAERRNSLSPPERRDTIDPGAHELAEASDSEEHFSDAQSAPPGSVPASPIPRTRVERVDDKPAYGEVPGTQAYQLREEDAEPDEIAYIPDPSDSTAAEPSRESRSPTPGGRPIPKTVVEESPDGDGSVTHPEIEERHKSDPHPDVIVKPDGQVVTETGEANDEPPLPLSLSTPADSNAHRRSSLTLNKSPLSPVTPAFASAVSEIGADGFEDDGFGDDDGEEGGDADFGDDFDDFEEGEGEGEDGDFGDFDTEFQEPEQPVQQHPVAEAPSQPAAAPALSFPIPNFDDLSTSAEIFSATEPYLSALFPDPDSLPTLPVLSSRDNPVFQTPRSASLWSQLVAPPPLQPPDWIRSRIRRLFLVSLGVPVDLDEILPASKQKKLVLPSLRHTDSNGSLRRASSDSRSRAPRTGSGPRNGERGASADSANASAKGALGDGAGKSKKKGGSAMSAGASGANDSISSFNLMSARQLCMTDEALSGMTDAELKAHVAKLEAMEGTAKEVLEYWQKQTDKKIGDREAFEGVIENLVKHARKVRK